jgi:probable rRNA maturation factor
MSRNKIFFFSEDVKYKIQGKNKIRIWLEEVTLKEKKKHGNINIVLCSDEKLLRVNIIFLNHDFYTDIITFEYTEGDEISGEMYISIDRVRENAKKYTVSIFDELCRVIVHGLLHLYGYDDKKKKQMLEMRKKEDYYLSLR